MRFAVAMIFILVFTGPSLAGTSRDDYMRMYTVKSDYEFVREDIIQAITAQGMRINNISHIGDMLARTGKDLGAKKQIFAKAEAFEFCSATVSRATMEADPHNIVFCPYIIAVYSLPGEGDTTYVSFRRPSLVGNAASRAALQRVEDLLTGIVEEATQ